MEPSSDAHETSEPADCGTILVVEGDEDIRESIAEVLEEEGHEVLVASNGAEALALLREIDKPCLIIMDLMMPEMDGWELREALRKRDELCSVPIVLLSGDANVQDRALDLGVAAGMAKPISLTMLLDTVARFRR